jgi:hypothetical protein
MNAKQRRVARRRAERSLVPLELVIVTDEVRQVLDRLVERAYSICGISRDLLR